MNIRNFLTDSRTYLALDKRTAISTTTARLQRSTMNSCRKVAQSLFLAAGLGALAAGPVLADPGCDHMGGHPGHHAQMQEQHHQQLHAALKLNPEQEPGWTKLMESEQAPAISEAQATDWSKLKAPERAEKMLELSKARQARMTEHAAALKAFYATLTPEQQKTFEDFHSGHHPRMHGKPGAKAAEQGKAASKP